MIRLLALLAILSVSAQAESTPPVSLCESGLSLGVRILRSDDATGWQEISPTPAPTLVDLGTGEYVLQDLPDASGRERYQVLLTSATEPGVVRASYTYGADRASALSGATPSPCHPRPAPSGLATPPARSSSRSAPACPQPLPSPHRASPSRSTIPPPTRY